MYPRLRLNATLKGPEQWSSDLKQIFNLNKTNLSVFSTDRKHRLAFRSTNIIFNAFIEKVSKRKNFDLVLDEKFGFNQLIFEPSSKVLKKLNILQRLCYMKWGAAPKTLKANYITLIRPIMEYFVPILSHSSASSLEKFNSVHARAAKVISGTVSTTNNLKIQQK